MKAIFIKSVEPEIRKKVGRLFRNAFRFKVEDIRESTIAPIIRRELKRYPGTYIKSHPRGTREGISRIELDIVAVDKREREAERVGKAVASEMVQAIRREGGRVARARAVVG